MVIVGGFYFVGFIVMVVLVWWVKMGDCVGVYFVFFVLFSVVWVILFV